MFLGTDQEVVIQRSVYSRRGADRVLRYAYELANAEKLKVGTKSNGIAISMPWWDSRADAVGTEFPDVAVDQQHIDIPSARFLLQPDRFDVIVATDLFGDILSDLGPACTGTIGLAPPANLNPERNSVLVRARSRVRARHLWKEHCQSNRNDLVCGADAGLSGRGEGAGRAAHDAIFKAMRPTRTGSAHPGYGRWLKNIRYWQSYRGPSGVELIWFG